MGPLFSPEQSVWDLQIRIREIDMSLSSSIGPFIDPKKTNKDLAFVYSTLAGCCALIDSENLSSFDAESVKFIALVKEVVEDCFQKMEQSSYDLNSRELRSTLAKTFNKIQFYPKEIEFPVDKNPELIAALTKVITVGTYTLYKVHADSPKPYAGRIDVSEECFLEAAALLEAHGYKKADDVVGSSFDKKGHVTTIDPRDLNDSVIAAHEAFVAASGDLVKLNPVGIKMGTPQAGRLHRLVGVVVEVENFANYREKLGLKPMQFSPHFSLFSQDIKPIASLKDVSIKAFTLRGENSYLSRLNFCMEQASQAQAESEGSAAAAKG